MNDSGVCGGAELHGETSYKCGPDLRWEVVRAWPAWAGVRGYRFKGKEGRDIRNREKTNPQGLVLNWV